jgi:hypothetical protein
MRTGIVAAAVVLACSACSARPPAPQVVEPDPARDAGTGEVGPLVWLGVTTDRLQFVGNPLHPDGHPDFACTARLSGPVVSLTIMLSDTRGKRVGASIWDTNVGDTPIPAVLDVPMKLGAQTANLGVYDPSGTLLNPDGALPPNSFFDGGWYTFVLPDWGGDDFTIEGRAFTLLVLRPDGRVDRTTVVVIV